MKYTNELDATRRWFAWRPVWCQEGFYTLGRRVWARHEFIGGNVTKRAYPPSEDDILVWRYYRDLP